MPSWVVRDDPVTFTGRVESVSPLVAFDPALWTFAVRPDAQHADLLVSRSGTPSPGGILSCSVAVDPGVAGVDKLASLASAVGQKVVVTGTWCDDEETDTTAIRPLSMLAIRRPLEVYDIDGWPTAVGDFEVYAFAHLSLFLVTQDDPHAGEPRTVSIRLPFPARPSNGATPFFRIYPTTVSDHSDGTATAVDDSATAVALELEVDTGDPGQGQGFWTGQIGVTFEEPELEGFCPPGQCDVDGHHCSFEGDERFMRVPPQIPYARTGDLAVSPGDGVGFISGVVASLRPPQVYDHMGILVDDGRTICHCTSSMDRLEDESLFTAEISVKLVGLIELDHQKVPLNGFRPDLVRFGWPGSITQTVEEVYRSGRNTLNPRWTFGTTHPGSDTEDPLDPGAPFKLYHLPRADRQRRLQFNDPERPDGHESMVRLQEASVTVGEPPTKHDALLVRPHPQFEVLARPAAQLVAQMALGIDAHYRFFAYTKGDIGVDPMFDAPPLGDSAWDGLPDAASWPAGSIGAMCSSFVWTAVQHANEKLSASGRPTILLEDRLADEDPAIGLEYGAQDGLYRYDERDRLDAGKGLVAKIKNKIRDRFDDAIPDAAYIGAPQLAGYRDVTAQRVANQLANAFGLDACESLDGSWAVPSTGETASPDNTIDFWDVKPLFGQVVQPEGHVAIYGDAVPVQLSAERWQRVPLARKHDTDLGTGIVRGMTRVGGDLVLGVTVRFDFGCAATMSLPELEGYEATLGTGRHFAEAFVVLPNPATGRPETFRTPRPVAFDVIRNQTVHVDLDLEPPPDLWRVVDVHLDADVHDRSFWGGDADARRFLVDRSFELRQDLEDDPGAPEEQQNTRLHAQDAWRTEPEVGSGVHVAVAYTADLDPSDRSVGAHVDVALIDTDSGGFLGIGTSSDVDELVSADVVVPEDQAVDVFVDVDLASEETVPERARVSLRLTNRRRPS